MNRAIFIIYILKIFISNPFFIILNYKVECHTIDNNSDFYQML
ncbi:hypothetical protein J500_0042 [Acinetobacter sp. 479375]|nr:hypothetical protein J500_0042 [Acinetobacter sp. 479375]